MGLVRLNDQINLLFAMKDVQIKSLVYTHHKGGVAKSGPKVIGIFAFNLKKRKKKLIRSLAYKSIFYSSRRI